MNVVLSVDRLDRGVPTGLQRVAVETARHLVQRGHTVTLLAMLRDGDRNRERVDDRDRVRPPGDFAGVRVVRYSERGGPLASTRAACKAVRELAARAPIDILNTHFAYTALGPRAALVGSRTPCVRTYHGAWDAEAIAERPTKPHDRVLYGIEWIGLRAVDHVVVLSDYARAQIVARFGVDDDRIDRIPGGVDIARFEPAGSRASYRAAFDVAPEAFVIASAGRLVKRKGFDRLIAAFPAILATIPEATLLIGGDGDEREALEAQIARANLSNRVRLLGRLDTTLPDLYRCADVVVVPSLTLETFGLVTIEALAAGTPVIGTPAGATPEILRDLDDVLVSRGTTSEALASSVLAFARSPARERLTTEHLTTFARCYSWGVHTAALERVFESTIAQRAHMRTR